ncbi:MAG: glutaredoxin family protein [Gammaproteobacteria bacterium]
MSLYYSPGCPFCKMVIKIISTLNITIELRNIDENLEYRNELVSVRGRATVPVLHITTPNGNERWMSESRDIINYLEKMYGNKD